MFKVKGFDHININVKNINKAKEFYENFFGFEVKEDYKYQSNGEEIRFMLIGISNKIMLCLYEGKSLDLESKSLGHIGINVENFEESYALAKAHNLINPKWNKVEYEHSKSFYIIDPNGLEFEISEKFAGGH